MHEEIFVQGKSISPHTHVGGHVSPVPTFLIQFLKFNFLLTILLTMLPHSGAINNKDLQTHYLLKRTWEGPGEE